MASFIDTHAHIHEGFDDVEAVVARARTAGVTAMLTLGVNRADSEAALALARRHEGVLAAAGVHPHDAKDASDDDLDALEAMAADPAVAVVGEIGLDFYRNLSPRDAQVRVFERQLQTADRVRKPVAVHARDAEVEVFDILRAWVRAPGNADGGRPPGVLHYFSGDADLAERYVEMGFLISVHTSVTHPKADRLREVVRRIGIGATVIETDRTYGAQQRYRGKRNEPAYVVEAGACMADVLGIGVDEVASATSAAAIRLLGI